MKTFIFKSSLVITIMFLLMSYLGGGPLGVQAAAKPTKTAKPTRTVRPIETFTPTATATDVPTNTPTYTPTPTDTPTDTPTATQTPTDTPTVSPCRISGTVSPSSGLKLPQTLSLFASDANHCDVPLQYTWNCTSGTSTACDSFIPSANVAPYGIPNPSILLNELDSFDIWVVICEIGTSNCSQVDRQYTAIEV